MRLKSNVTVHTPRLHSLSLNEGPYVLQLVCVCMCESVNQSESVGRHDVFKVCVIKFFSGSCCNVFVAFKFDNLVHKAAGILPLIKVIVVVDCCLC